MVCKYVHLVYSLYCCAPNLSKGLSRVKLFSIGKVLFIKCFILCSVLLMLWLRTNQSLRPKDSLVFFLFKLLYFYVLF